MDDLTLEQVMSYLEENATDENVQNYINSFVTPERVNSFLDGDQGWPILQPRFDKQFSKSLDTWKNNNLQKIIDDEIRNRFPDETPEAQRMREMEQKIANMEKEKLFSNMRNLAITEGNELGLPTALAASCVCDTEEETRAKVKQMEVEFKSAIEKEVEARMSKGYRPKGGQGADYETGRAKYEEGIKERDPAKVLAAKLGL